MCHLNLKTEKGRWQARNMETSAWISNMELYRLEQLDMGEKP